VKVVVVSTIQRCLSKPALVSYGFVVVALLLVGLLHLGVPFIATLFAYLALAQLNFIKHRGRWLPVVLFVVLVAALAYGLGYVINQAVRVVPDVAEQAIPSVIQWAKQHQIELPFTDYDSLKDLALDTVRSQAHNVAGVAKVARGATSQFVLVIAAIVFAIGLFLNPRFESTGDKPTIPNNLYSLTCAAIAERFTIFYRSFAMVMGAQVVISAINTVFTAIFVLSVRLPYAIVVIGTTFLCGLLPIVGNLISNCIVLGIAITVSPKLAIAALVFLVVIHKLEYFLNSKIVGNRIRNPFWLTLLALILGERLLGIPGMVLAPVVLNYFKIETSRIEIHHDAIANYSSAGDPLSRP
jgi:predicted PurR-regulated permease PerM